MKIEIKKEIEKRLDKIINDVQKLIETIEVNRKKLWDKKVLEINQMRNLVDVANSIDSIKAIELFIQYQMGRKKIPKEFGQKIIEKINEQLKNQAEEIYNEKKIEDCKIIWLELIRQYFGYMNRYFIYKKKVFGEESES
ncbi:MAG: hypothetical protein ACTSVV_09545 [Promethearchaeota archaeon]